MYSKYLPTVFVVISLLFASSTHAQDDNPVDDPDLKALLKQAQEMQKNARELQKNPGSLDTRKKIADMEAAAKAEEARQEQEEKHENEKLQAAPMLPTSMADGGAPISRHTPWMALSTIWGTVIPINLPKRD